jgi:hypothetical protein
LLKKEENFSYHHPYKTIKNYISNSMLQKVFSMDEKYCSYGVPLLRRMRLAGYVA